MFEFLCHKKIQELETKIFHLKDTNVQYNCIKQHMMKKNILLDLHRQSKDVNLQKKLIIEINLLADLINGDKINEEDISGTLTCVPFNDKY